MKKFVKFEFSIYVKQTPIFGLLTGRFWGFPAAHAGRHFSPGEISSKLNFTLVGAVVLYGTRDCKLCEVLKYKRSSGMFPLHDSYEILSQFVDSSITDSSSKFAWIFSSGSVLWTCSFGVRFPRISSAPSGETVCCMGDS